MKVLAVCSQKGGVGKTSIATTLAVAAQVSGRSVLVMDLDEQASAAFWGDVRAAPPLVKDVKPARLTHYLDVARAAADLVIIDVPPQHATTITAATPADFVLVPTKPDLLDLRSARATISLLQSIGKPMAVVLTFVPAVGPELEQATAALAGLGVEIAPPINQRKAWARAPQNGLTVIESEPNSPAAMEALALWQFVEKKLYGKKAKPRRAVS